MVKQALSSQPCYISLDRPWGTFALRVGQGWENLFNTSHVQDSAVLLFFQLSIPSTEHSKNSCIFHMDCWKSKIFRSQKLQHKLCIDGEHTQQMCNVVAPFTHHTQELLLGSAEPLSSSSPGWFLHEWQIHPAQATLPFLPGHWYFSCWNRRGPHPPVLLLRQGADSGDIQGP